MKKYSFGFILIEIAVMIIICLIPTFIVYFMTPPEKNLYTLVLILAAWIVFLLYLMLANVILFPIARRTMNKKLDEAGLIRTRTFDNKESHSCASVLVIDETHEKIAYVSSHNPFKLQVADVKDLTNIRSSYIKGPFGGTRYVYYQFTYKGKRTRIPTFTSRHMFSLSSGVVQDAIIKANRFYDSITGMQNKNG